MSKAWAWLGIALVLTACAPQPVITLPTPTPQVVRVQYTPSISTWTQALSTCAGRDPDIALVVQEVSAPAVDLTKAEFALRIGAPDTLPIFSAPIGTEEIIVVVHPTNPVSILTLDQLRAIYTGTIPLWESISSGGNSLVPSSAGTPIQVWTTLPGDDLGQAFLRDILGNEILSKGAYEAPFPGAMLEAVAQNPSAIGIIPKRWLNSSVQAVQIKGMEGTLSEPVLALANAEPTGEARRLVACLQGSK
jgi:ABC-type phosphate transport system substrate-binding protein